MTTTKKVKDERFLEMEREAAEWMAEVLDRPVDALVPPGGDLCDALRDGTALCELANAVTPGAVRYKRSAMPFKQMENIAAFLAFCHDGLHVPQHDLFQTIDLWERKNPAQVVSALHAFSRHAVQRGALAGRYLGPKMATVSARQFSEQQMREARNHVNTYQYGKFSGSTNVPSGTTRRDPAGHFH